MDSWMAPANKPLKVGGVIRDISLYRAYLDVDGQLGTLRTMIHEATPGFGKLYQGVRQLGDSIGRKFELTARIEVSGAGESYYHVESVDSKV